MKRIALLGLATIVLGACSDATEPYVVAHQPPPLFAATGIAIGTESPITTDPASQIQPAIDGDHVVWADNRNGNSDVFLLDLGTGAETQITSDPSDQLEPAISAGRIVWLDLRNGNFDVYMFDLATGSETQISTASTHEFMPAISGDRVVWRGDAGNVDIFMFDLASGVETQITNDNNIESYPVIDRDRIFWLEYVAISGARVIAMYDVTAGTETHFHSGIGSLSRYLGVFQDRLVWDDSRNGNFDVFVFDLATGTEIQLTADLADQEQPSISGDRIAWQDGRNGNLDIFMLDLVSGGESQVTTDPFGQRDPAISGDRIVWTDSRNGNNDIFLFEVGISPAPGMSILSMTDLGALPGHNQSRALGTNSLGQVVGFSTVSGTSVPRAFLWTARDAMRDLGTATGLTHSTAVGINDLGQVVGTGSTTWLWTELGGMVDIRSLSGGVVLDVGDINNGRQILGLGAFPAGLRAVIWTETAPLLDLGTLPGGNLSRGGGINELGEVAGFSTTASADQHAILWTPAAGMEDLGTLGGCCSQGADINDLRIVVGESRDAAGGIRAFRWTRTAGMVSLGTLGGDLSRANAINSSGHVVGASRLASGDFRAFFWSAASGMVDLGSFATGSSEAFDVSEADENGVVAVVGESTTGPGESHATLWVLEVAVTPQDQIGAVQDGIQDLVDDGTLTPEQGNTLNRTLNRTLRFINAGRPCSAITGQVKAFRGQVNDLTPPLSQGQAQALIDAVEDAADDVCP
jgi:beta propeller repeat protein/probable HAF family extracellular repeat protein